eukprot:Ihof_evm1s1305 gene=Ihof_evmTU1s1305
MDYWQFVDPLCEFHENDREFVAVSASDVDVSLLSSSPTLQNVVWNNMHGANSKTQRIEPLLWIGGLFSTQCWQRTDKLIIDYLHSGGPRMWYVVSPDAYESMENYVVYNKEDLEYTVRFMANNHMPFQIAPWKLQERDIAIDNAQQKEGEFVVVLPGSYYMFINCG